MPATTKKLSTKQLVASLIIDADVDSSKTIYVIKTPRADAKHVDNASCICYRCHPERNGGLLMYGLQFTDGITVTTDKELADKIVAEFPDYKMEELA